MKTGFKLLYLIFLITLAACEEVVDMDLESSEPRLVIDATITEGVPCQVILSRSQDFYNNNGYERVYGKLVILRDDIFQTE